MFALSWSGVQYCVEALRTPKCQKEVIHAIINAGNIRPSTAYEYLRLAQRLGLVVKDAEGRFALAVPIERPEELIEASTLIRLFHARHRLNAPLFLSLDPEEKPLEPFGIVTPEVLRSADGLAKRLQGVGDDLPPQAALILEMTRLWSETHARVAHTPPLSAALGFRSFERLSAAPRDVERGSAEAFVRACMLLYGLKLLRLSIVQYATDANRPFAPFRTALGYIKWIHSPVPYRGPRDAEPLQASRKLVSFG